MALDNFTPIPLFDELSVEEQGGVFVVLPREIAILRAFGFQDFVDRVDSSTARTEQSACLEMLLFKETPLPRKESGCGGIIDFNKYRGKLMAAEQVRIDGCSVGISKCNNLILWNIPGSYRFIMNDKTAVGEARIYLQIISKDEFPWNSNVFV